MVQSCNNESGTAKTGYGSKGVLGDGINGPRALWKGAGKSKATGPPIPKGAGKDKGTGKWHGKKGSKANTIALPFIAEQTETEKQLLAEQRSMR